MSENLILGTHIIADGSLAHVLERLFSLYREATPPVLTPVPVPAPELGTVAAAA